MEASAVHNGVTPQTHLKVHPMSYVKLPNQKIVRVDQNNFINVQVELELSDIINNDLEGVLDLLSEQATGSEVLSNITYTVVGHCGNTLSVNVTGDISMIDFEEVEEENLFLREFEIQVTRIGYGTRTLRLSARTEDEARDIADDDAGNHTYSEHLSNYVIEACAV